MPGSMVNIPKEVVEGIKPYKSEATSSRNYLGSLVALNTGAGVGGGGGGILKTKGQHSERS